MGKRGPTPKGEYAGQTAVLSTRISPDLRALLEAEVEKSGKTLSREIEHRLRRSFAEDDKIHEAFGSKRNYALMRGISMVLEFWHNPSDIKSDWTRDPVAYEQVCKKIDAFLDLMRPAGKAVDLSEDDRALADLSARSHPAGVIDELQHASSAIPIGGGHRSRALSIIKGDLGEMLDRSLSKKSERTRDSDATVPAENREIAPTAQIKSRKAPK